MRGFEVAEELPDWADSCSFYIIQALTNALFWVDPRRNIEETLISLGILHDCGGLSIDGQHDRPLGSPERFDEIARGTAKRCQGLNVGCNVEH
jgi:hypothetical protein